MDPSSGIGVSKSLIFLKNFEDYKTEDKLLIELPTIFYLNQIDSIGRD
jgi:hypothetical protein